MSSQLSIPGVKFTPVGLEIPTGIDFETWQELGNQLREFRSASSWWVADWFAFGEGRFRDRVSQALEARDASYGGAANLATVARRFPVSRRRENLSLSVHREVLALPEPEQDRILDEAEALGLSSRDVREMVRDVRGRAPNPSRCPFWQKDESTNNWGCVFGCADAHELSSTEER